MRTTLFLAAALAAWPGGPTPGLIDRRVSERWEAEGVRAAPAADDYEFLRRLSIDLRGVIPTVEEIRAFAADRDAAKREKVVDAWLRSEEHARAWSRRWTEDLTINAGLKGKYRGLYDPFEGWVQDAVRSNMPYDRFVKRLLTSKGPLDFDPAAGFLMAGLTTGDGGPKDVVERASRLFLGTQIRCAECHDHPFDDWTQQDFYAMAAFFWQSRAEVRSGKESNELQGWIVDDPARGDPPVPGNGKEKGSFPAAYKASGEGPREREPRRSAFARLLAADPQFARAAVNRHWGLLLGRGLVHPLDGFAAARKPSHPELLDELAADFARSGYDVRRLMKAILLSKAYQVSSKGEPAPDRLFARALAAPMAPEQLYESLVRATGLQDQRLPTQSKGDPRDVREAFLREFRPPFEQNDPFAAPAEATITQALFFLNGDATSRAVAAAVRHRQVKGQAPETDPARRLEEMFLRFLGRPPSAREAALVLERVRARAEAPEAFEDVAWALLNSTEFVTRH